VSSILRTLRQLISLFLLSAGCITAADSPPGCIGSSPLGRFRVSVYRHDQSAGLALKSVSSIPAGAKLVWEPIHLPIRFSQKTEIAVLIMPRGNASLITLLAHRAGERAAWDLPEGASVIAVVLGPDGLNMSKVKTLIAGNEDLLPQLADYAQQTSEVESLIQGLADSEQSHIGAGAALQGFASRWGISTPKLDTKAPTNQQAATLLSAVLPTANLYDPLSPASQQVQQTTGLAASVAGVFFGSSIGLAAGGTALVSDLRSALFPNTEFRSAIAQAADGGVLAFCGKEKAPAARTRAAYLWPYRLPNIGRPTSLITGPAYLPTGSKSAVPLKSSGADSKQLAQARDWRLIPVAGGDPLPVPVALGTAPDSLSLDLSKAKPAPGDYKLEATWDWDPLNLGTLHLRAYSDFSKAAIAPASKDQLIEGRGIVSVKLTGADFEFVSKVQVQRTGAKAPKPVDAAFEIPGGAAHGEQPAMTVDVDTARAGSYHLLLAQSDGVAHEVPIDVLPPNPAISNLPLRVNLGESSQPLSLQGKGLARVMEIASDAGRITGAAEGDAWAAKIELKNGAHAGQSYALKLKVQGLDVPVTIPNAIQVVGPRPRITAVRKSQPLNAGIEIGPDELPSGTSVGLVLSTAHLDDPSGEAVGRPHLELGCESGESRQTLKLSPDEHASGATLSFAGQDSMYLALDPGTVGYPGCELAASISVDPKGSSDKYSLGRVVRIPRLDRFTLTGEALGPNTYAGILKGHDLDLIEKAGWSAETGLPVSGIAAPAAASGDAAEQTLRIALPWPSPSPHAPLYIWLRGEQNGRRTGVSD
jgi:hypothetical protein